MFIIKTNKSALTAGNKINGYSSKAALAKDMLVILLGKNLEIISGLLEVRDEEGRDGKLLVLPGEPQLVAAIPSQGVEVGEEGGFLHVLPHEGVQGGEG